MNDHDLDGLTGETCVHLGIDDLNAEKLFSRYLDAGDLLSRTVFYKVGHHSSHSATVREHGLELMLSEDLVAMIPVDRQVALSKKWQMPADALYKRLVEKTRGRVIRSDVGWPEDLYSASTLTAAEWKQVRDNASIKEEALYFEYEMI